MDKDQLRQITKDTHIEMGYHSLSSVNLSMGTFAQESRLCEFIEQIGGGPAVGPGQMEPATFWDHFNKYLTVEDEDGNKHLKSLARKIQLICNFRDWDPRLLRYNLKFAICMTRVHYLRKREALPGASDIEGMARYWKRYYNTYLGAGTEQEFVNSYKTYVL